MHEAPVIVHLYRVRYALQRIPVPVGELILRDRHLVNLGLSDVDLAVEYEVKQALKIVHLLGRNLRSTGLVHGLLSFAALDVLYLRSSDCSYQGKRRR